MFPPSENSVGELMDLEEALLSFINRVNDAYIASHSIHDLVYDSDYQRLTIKHGKAQGLPLGNRHLLPGYWFTTFVAPYESFQRVLQALKNEESQQNELKQQPDNTKVIPVVNKFKHLVGLNPLQPLVEKFQVEIEFLLNNMETLEDATNDNKQPNKRSLKRVVNAIASGSYEFAEEDDLICTFYDNDSLCGYKFEARVKVATFNQFAIDFSKQLVDLLWPIVENHKLIRKEVASMFIGQVFLKEL